MTGLRIKRDIFLHIHIPKSGGTTFGEILKNNFGRHAGSDNAFLSNRCDSKQVELMIHSYPRLMSFSSHKLSLDLPFHLENISIHAIAFIRDPIDRFISHYFYHRNNVRINIVPAARRLSLQEYITYALVQGHQPAYINGQTLYLSGSPDERGLYKISKTMDDGYLLLFPVDRFDESCVVLENLYPRYFRDCAYLRRNMSIKDQAVTEEDRQCINQFVAIDRDLYQRAHTFLDHVSGNCFGSEDHVKKALRDFRERCKRLQKRLQIQSFLGGVYRAMSKRLGV